MITMKNLYKGTIVGMVFLIALAGSVNATEYDCTTCSNCTDMVDNVASAGDIVKMTQNLTYSFDTDCISASSMDGVTLDCDGYRFTDTDQLGGYTFDLAFSDNFTIRNCEIYADDSGNKRQINLANINNATFSNIYVYEGGHSNAVIYGEDCNDLVFEDITLEDPKTRGIYLHSTINRTTLRNINITGTPSADFIRIGRCHTNGVFEYVNLTGSSPVGIDFYTSPAETCGAGHTWNNTLSHSRIEGATVGIELISNVIDNLFYDNYFNNTDNVANSSVVSNNWNTTYALGTNIVGGYYVGGNYWANPSGTGYSDTCTDTTPADGICDTPFEVTSYDYLALTAPVAPPVPDVIIDDRIMVGAILITTVLIFALANLALRLI